MTEKFFVTTYDRAELVFMFREAFKVELREYLDGLKTENDDNILQVILQVN